MKSYKDFEKRYLGCTDVATINVFTNQGLYQLATGSDDSFSAYWVEGEAIIGNHYTLVKEINNVTYLVVSDESHIRITEQFGDGLPFYPKTIKIYQAGEHGIIFQLIDERQQREGKE